MLRQVHHIEFREWQGEPGTPARRLVTVPVRVEVVVDTARLAQEYAERAHKSKGGKVRQCRGAVVVKDVTP